MRRFVRDSVPVPRRRSARVYKAILSSADEIAPDCVNPNQVDLRCAMKRNAPSDRFEQQATKRRRMHRDHAVILDGLALAHWRQERSKRFFQPTSSTPAVERLARIRAGAVGLATSS